MSERYAVARKAGERRRGEKRRVEARRDGESRSGNARRGGVMDRRREAKKYGGVATCEYRRGMTERSEEMKIPRRGGQSERLGETKTDEKAKRGKKRREEAESHV